MVLEVTDERVDGDPRISLSDLLCRRAKDALADIERDVELERSVPESASRSSRVFSDVPEPSSTSVSA